MSSTIFIPNDELPYDAQEIEPMTDTLRPRGVIEIREKIKAQLLDRSVLHWDIGDDLRAEIDAEIADAIEEHPGIRALVEFAQTFRGVSDGTSTEEIDAAAALRKWEKG